MSYRKHSMGTKEIIELIIAGFFGSLVRLVLDPPKDSWTRWAAQVFVGLCCAVFIGGMFAHFTNAGDYGFLAWGFVIGSMGEKALKKVQDRFFGLSDRTKKDKSEK